MSTPFEIPTRNNPQKLSISLLNVTYRITLKWNQNCQAWIMDMADINSSPILTGIPLVSGLSLLEQFEYLGIGGELFAQVDNDINAIPTFDNLGSTGHLYFVVP